MNLIFLSSDLNKELDKMKDLLNDIVSKMSSNAGGKSALEENSLVLFDEDERRSPHDGTSVIFLISHSHLRCRLRL